MDSSPARYSTRFRAAVVSCVIALFVVCHEQLLTPAGRIRGFNSDAAIIGLMGKKMLEGRGFDIFFWGQNYIGPLTSILTGMWGVLLGGADALALRLAAFTEVLGGTLLIWWGLDRIDSRAAAASALALALAPPVLLRLMVNPLGAEMAFLMSAALFALLMQHFTAGEGRGVLTLGSGQAIFGVLAGVSWWMNQQVVFVLLAGAFVLAFRSSLGERFRRALRLRDRFLLHLAIPGAVQAFALVLTVAGAALLVAYFCAIALPFVFGRVADAFVLILVAQLAMSAVSREWRSWDLHFTQEQVRELMAVARFAGGATVGYAPVWLGRLFGWYQHSYVFGVRPIEPAELAGKVRDFVSASAEWSGVAAGAVGAAYAVVLALFVLTGIVQARTSPRLFVALVPLGNAAWYLATHGASHHYFAGSVGMLLGVAALGAMHWAERRARNWVAVAAVVSFLSIASASHAVHRDVLHEKDPLDLTRRIADAQCSVVYADFWIAYRQRFLDSERHAWIPYRSRDRSPGESREFQTHPGQRCLVDNRDRVIRIDGDLPLRHRVSPNRAQAYLPEVGKTSLDGLP